MTNEGADQAGITLVRDNSPLRTVGSARDALGWDAGGRFGLVNQMPGEPSVIHVRVTVEEMPSLKSLLTHVAAVQRRSPTIQSVGWLERAFWTVLVVLGIGWGIVAGVSFAGTHWVEPLTGVLGCLGLLVLAVTLRAWASEQSTRIGG